MTYYLLVVMEVATRRVSFAGLTPCPHEAWMRQIARNLTAADDGFLLGKRYLLMDRDTKFSAAFRTILAEAGVKPVRLPTRSPNLNAHLERFGRSRRQECVSRMIFFGENMLRRASPSYLDHYHGERNHQGLDNPLIDPGNEVAARPAWCNTASVWVACFGTTTAALPNAAEHTTSVPVASSATAEGAAFAIIARC